ncbi:MAG TPA: FAD-dependent oxidoreductase, partial [Planctomycetota bacterium]|nr:FAD-dependent oxidoreductase [Planctomycetota bacterium]
AWALNRTVKDIHAGEDGKVATVSLVNTQTNEVEEHACDGIFIAIGHKPNSDMFRGKVDMNDVGYIHVKPGTTYTSVPGLFACGDVADAVYRQAITAAGTGCMAAIDAERWLENQSHA